jgi:hypothetical protein
MDKNHKAAEELGEQISKQTKSTLIPGVELLLLDSKLKDNKPGVELKTKKSLLLPQSKGKGWNPTAGRPFWRSIKERRLELKPQ